MRIPRLGLRRGFVASIDAQFAALGAAIFLSATGIGMLYPLLAKIQTEHGLGTYALGLMSGANFFAALLAQLCVGRFLDGTKARRVLLGGLLLGVVALLWFARAGDLWQLVASRALSGISYGIIGPAALREAAVGTEGPKRGQRLGVLSSMMMAGIVIGPLAGSVLAVLGGVPLPFEVLAALLAVLFVVCAALPRRQVAAFDPEAPAANFVRPALRPIVALLLLSAASMLPNGLYDSLWSRLLTDRGGSELLIGLSLSLFGLPFVILAPFGGRLAERRGPLLAGAIGLILADGFMASYGFVPSPVVIVILGVAEACVQSVAVPGGYAAVARVFPDEQAATGQGWFSGAGTAAAGMAAVTGAPLYAVIGPGGVFAGGAGLSILFAVASVWVAGRSPALAPIRRGAGGEAPDGVDAAGVAGAGPMGPSGPQ